MQRPGEIENVKKKSHVRARKVLKHGIGTVSEPVAKDEERFVAAARSSAERRGAKGQMRARGSWFGGPQTGSLWLCYARPSAGGQKSGISGNQ